jgi:hypothetical protein
MKKPPGVRLVNFAGLCATGKDNRSSTLLVAHPIVRLNPDLDGIRDGPELARLPEPERAALHALWADVEALRKKAEAKAWGRSEPPSPRSIHATAPGLPITSWGWSRSRQVSIASTAMT